MLNKGKCKDFLRQQRQIWVSSCPCCCSAWAAGAAGAECIIPASPHQPRARAGSRREIWQLKASSCSNKQCLPSLQVYRESHWCRWLGKEKGKQQRSQPSTHRESGGMVAVPYISVAAGALEHQGGFCWDEEEWTWGCGLQHATIFKFCLSPLSVSVGSLAYFLALDFVSQTQTQTQTHP